MVEWIDLAPCSTLKCRGGGGRGGANFIDQATFVSVGSILEDFEIDGGMALKGKMGNMVVNVFSYLVAVLWGKD